MRGFSRAAMLAVLLAGAVACVQAEEVGPAEADAAAQITGVRIGFDGRYKVGYWTPFAVTVNAGEEPLRGEVTLTALDGDGVPSRVTSPNEVALEPGQITTLKLYAKVGRLRAPIQVELRSDREVLAARTLTSDDPAVAGALPSSGTLLISLGGPFVAADEPWLAQRQLVAVPAKQLDDLPDAWWGYDGADCVVLALHDREFATAFAAAGPKAAALAEWVRLGGRLLISAGRNADVALAASSPLAKLVPATFESLVPLRQTTPFESYVETVDPLELALGTALQVPRLRDMTGRIEAYAGTNARDLPLVVRAPLGFGEVTFVGFDLAEAPFSTWRARPQLLERLLRGAAPTGDDKQTSGLGQVTTLGFEDLSGQLRGALDQFVGVTLAPFWLVAVLIFAYILCIGPLDYYFVKRILGRMEATWITFALTVAVFCIGAYALAYGLKGDRLRLNRVDVVDFDATSQLVRGTSWASLFTPATDSFDLSLKPTWAASGAEPAGAPAAATQGVLFSWLGLPGAGFGGMDAGAGESPLGGDAVGATTMFTEPYQVARDLNGMSRMPVPVWSSKALVGRWWRPGGPPVEAQLIDTGRLGGTLHNTLQVPITSGLLVFERWAYPIREWPAGATLDVRRDLSQQTVDTYLRRVVVQGDRNVAPPYERATFDLRRIVEMLSIHELAGGQKYTGLAHDYQQYFDMSHLVQNRRAVLLVQVERPATLLERDGRPLEDAEGQRLTFLRMVFPVGTATKP